MPRAPDERTFANQSVKRYTEFMVIKLQHLRTAFVVTALALTCAQFVSAQNKVKIPVRKNPQTGSGLSISSPGEISNTKSVDVNGAINMNAGKSIINGTSTAPASIKASSSVTLNAPTIHNSGTITAGSGNVNISTTNLINSGSITAKSGDVNISNHSGNSLSVNNANGSITGKTVTFKVNDSDKSKNAPDQSGSIKLNGGTISGETINVGGADTKVNVDADKIDGKLNVPGTYLILK
jgi:hypothetical protein